MATSVTSTTTNAATSTSTTPVTTSNTTSTTAGISTATSSISSAADNQGFSAQISAWISSVMDTIRNCLSKLPLIGSWFEKATPATTTSTTSTTTTTTTWSDAELLAMIRGQFVAAGGTTSTTTIAAPAADVVAYALNNFNQIQSPVTKMDAFLAVLSAVNSTDDIARQFYNGLPEGTPNVEASRSAFRNHLWIANGRTSVIGGVDQGMGFGDHIIGTAPRGPLAQQAAQNLRAALAAAAVTTSTSTSTSTAASTSTTTAATSSTTVVINRAADAGHINGIRNILTAADAAGTAVTAPILANIVNLFTQIQGPVTKMDAFQMILTSARSTPALMQQCFAALPVGAAGTLEASQEALKFQMWKANGDSSFIGLVDHGMNFGAHVIGNVGVAPCDLLTRTASTNLRALLAA